MVYIFFVIIFLLKFIYSLNLGLVPDEAYYWEWSRNLDLSYYDQGPATAYYIKIFTSIFGNTHLALKLAASFGAFLTILFLVLTSKILNFNSSGIFWVLVLSFFVPGFFGGSLFIMHDTVLLIFWSSALYFSINYILYKKNWAIYFLFFSLAIGALAKHTMVFFALGLILWIIFSKEEFILLKNIHFWMGLLLACILISPLLYWNIQNGWENIDAILNLRSSGGVNFSKATTGLYIAGQLLAFSPIWYLVIVFLFFKTLFNLRNFILIQKLEIQIPSELKLLFINACILPVFFLILSFKKDIQANWVFPSYLAIILLIAFQIQKQKKLKSIFIVGLVFAILMNLFSLFSSQIINTLALKIEPYYIPSYRDKGFKEIVQEAESLKENLDKEANFVANRYQDAAILSWYGKGQPFVKSLNILQKNQYNLWNGIEKNKNYILLSIQENTCKKSFIFFQPYLKFMFQEVKEFPEKDLIYDGKVIKRYQFWYLKNYTRTWADPVSQFISKKLILELMPNLRGFKPFEMKEKISGDGVLEIFMQYLDKEGETSCSVF